MTHDNRINLLWQQRDDQRNLQQHLVGLGTAKWVEWREIMGGIRWHRAGVRGQDDKGGGTRPRETTIREGTTKGETENDEVEEMDYGRILVYERQTWGRREAVTENENGERSRGQRAAPLLKTKDGVPEATGEAILKEIGDDRERDGNAASAIGIPEVRNYDATDELDRLAAVAKVNGTCIGRVHARDVPADWVRIELEGGISHLWCGKAVGSKRDLMPRCHTFNLKPVPPGTCSGVFSSPRSGVCTMVNFHKLRASSKMLSSASKTLKRVRGACKGKSRRGITGTSTGLDSAEATLTSPGPCVSRVVCNDTDDVGEKEAKWGNWGDEWWEIGGMRGGEVRDRKGSVKKGGMAKGATTGAPVSQG
ncbi:hypothetical protein EDB84DRAFT_1442422 [Lactarius hengduanensis]|nr:hypothetical protein EDB84DRAFT_1442422 [Lactarius hengduanensis]